jgi:mediator of RNA polymerase II transcription subunit 30
MHIAKRGASVSQEVNTSTVCRIGQETVEEIVSRTQEVFSILKQLQVGYYM